MLIDDLLNIRDLDTMLTEGYVRFGIHPIFPNVRIFNYTEKAQFANEWNDITRQCRGLIVDWDTKEVLARPFDKFMNYGQDQADVILAGYSVKVYDKLDGSLGILFRRPDGFWEIATRGSFQSDQASHATILLRQKYSSFLLGLNSDLTYMFEIIYPQNRIVLDYGDKDSLVLLGARSIDEGSTYGPESLPDWHWDRTTTFPYKTLSEALKAPPRPNAEGYVVYFPELDHRVKIKQDDYIAMHKIVTGLTERRIWENMKEGKTLEDLVNIIPDEWHDWLQETYTKIKKNYWAEWSTILEEFNTHTMWLDVANYQKWSRKDFALRVKDSRYKGFMFLMLDNNNVTDKVWQLVRPPAESLL